MRRSQTLLLLPSTAATGVPCHKLIPQLAGGPAQHMLKAQHWQLSSATAWDDVGLTPQVHLQGRLPPVLSQPSRSRSHCRWVLRAVHTWLVRRAGLEPNTSPGVAHLTGRSQGAAADTAGAEARHLSIPTACAPPSRQGHTKETPAPQRGHHQRCRTLASVSYQLH